MPVLRGGTLGTAPPITLNLELARLIRPRPRRHPRDEGAHIWFISSVCSGGTLDGQLRRWSVVRRSGGGDSEQTLARTREGVTLEGQLRRLSMATRSGGGDSEQTLAGTREGRYLPQKRASPSIAGSRSGWLRKGDYRRTPGPCIACNG